MYSLYIASSVLIIPIQSVDSFILLNPHTKPLHLATSKISVQQTKIADSLNPVATHFSFCYKENIIRASTCK